MRVLVLNEMGFEFCEVSGEYEDYSALVGGWIEVVYLPNDILCVVNEEGKILNLPPVGAFSVDGKVVDLIAGQCFFCADILTDEGGDFGELTEEQVKFLRDEMWKGKVVRTTDSRKIPVLAI